MSAKATVPAREQGPRIVAVNARAHDRRVEAEDNTPISAVAVAVEAAACARRAVVVAASVVAAVAVAAVAVAAVDGVRI
jgi:hypothetical protein